MAFFTEIEQRQRQKSQIFMEKQKKNQIAKEILRKKNGVEESGSLNLDYTTKLQSSKKYGTDTKIEI